MRSLVVAGTFFCLLGSAFGQGRGQYWSLGGFGNVVYPGIGHAPPTPVGGVTGLGFGGGMRFGAGNRGSGASHPGHDRGTVVYYPVYYGGYGYGYGYDPSLGYGPGYGDPPPVINSGSPPVIINQSFVPPQANPVVREYAPADNDQSSLKMYTAPVPGGAAPAVQQFSPAMTEPQPTLYLIAFKDHTIIQALGYWMEGSTLHYVTLDHDLNQVSLDLIDRELSQRLNNERHVEFRLPAAR